MRDELKLCGHDAPSPCGVVPCSVSKLQIYLGLCQVVSVVTELVAHPATCPHAALTHMPLKPARRSTLHTAQALKP